MKMSEEWENYCLTCRPLRVNYKHTKHMKYSHNAHTHTYGQEWATVCKCLIGNQIRINMNLFCRNVKMKNTSTYSNTFFGSLPRPRRSIPLNILHWILIWCFLTLLFIHKTVNMSTKTKKSRICWKLLRNNYWFIFLIEALPRSRAHLETV